MNSRTKRRKLLFFAAATVFVSTLAATLLLADIASPPSEISPFAPCDLDKDGHCDQTDRQLFEDAFGTCRGDSDYSFEADIDGDGCVTDNDEKFFRDAQKSASDTS